LPAGTIIMPTGKVNLIIFSKPSWRYPKSGKEFLETGW